MSNITPAQCRAARGLLCMSQARLAELIGVSRLTICRFEKHYILPPDLSALKAALERKGVVFSAGPERPDGVWFWVSFV
jgi:DNA-binding XRE family transcriptional regulator